VASSAATPASCSGAPIYKGTDTTFTHTGLIAGKTYHYRVCAADNAKNMSAGATGSRKAFTTVSDTAPKLTLSTLSDKSTTTVGTVNIAGTSEGGNRISSVTVNGAEVTGTEFSLPLLLSDAGNSVTVTATDEAGKTTNVTRTITLDKTTPLFTIASPADNSATGAEMIAVTGMAATSDKVELRVNSETEQPGDRKDESFSKTLYLQTGMNTIEVSAIDLSGNRSVQKRTVYRNSFGIDLSVTDPVCDVRIATPSITITGSVSGANTTITIEADGQSYTPAITGGVFEQKITFDKEETCRVKVTAKTDGGDETTVIRNIVYRKALRITQDNGETILLLDAPEQQKRVTEMQLSADGVSWSGWEAYTTAKRLETAADSAHARFRDAEGNISPVYADTLVTGK